MNRSNKYLKGLTTIEVIVVLAVIAVVLTVLGATSASMAARAELDAAEEYVSEAVRNARNLARASQSAVTLVVAKQNGHGGFRISFEPTDGPDSEYRRLDVPDVYLPESIAVLSDARSITFDRRGLVESPEVIVLAGEGREEEVRTVHVGN